MVQSLQKRKEVRKTVFTQGIRRPKKSERKRIRKVGDDGADKAASAAGRTAAEQIQEQLGFDKEDEGEKTLLSVLHRLTALCWGSKQG